MASVNRVMLMGRLSRDPVLRRLSDNVEVADFGLAISEWAGGKDAERKEKVIFVDVVVWERQAAACGEHLRKGMPVFVEGRLQMDEWTDKQSGDKRYKIRVRADRVHFMGGPRAAGEGGEPPRREEAVASAERAPDRSASSRGRPMARSAA